MNEERGESTGDTKIRTPKRYVKVGLGNKTSSGPGSPGGSRPAKCASCRAPVLRCTVMRLSPRSTIVLNSIAQCASGRAHLSSGPVLLSSQSLAPSLQQVTSSLCQQLHTCANAKTIQRYPLVPLPLVFFHLQPSEGWVQPSVRQSPPATILAGRTTRVADEAGSSTDGC